MCSNVWPSVNRTYIYVHFIQYMKISNADTRSCFDADPDRNPHLFLRIYNRFKSVSGFLIWSEFGSELCSFGCGSGLQFHVEASGSCLDPAFHCDVNPDQVIKLFAPVQFTSICQYDIRLFCADPDSFLKSCPFHADPDCNCCVGLTSAMYPL